MGCNIFPGKVLHTGVTGKIIWDGYHITDRAICDCAIANELYTSVTGKIICNGYILAQQENSDGTTIKR